MRSSFQTVNGDWAGESGNGMQPRSGRSDDHRPIENTADPATFPSAIEFVKAAALRIREQTERIQVLEAERAHRETKIAELEASVGRQGREHLETLELLEQSLVECSILRVALREAAREAQTAEGQIRSTIREIDDLKVRFANDELQAASSARR